MIDEIEDHKSRGLKGARNFLFDSAKLRIFWAHSPKKGLPTANLTDFTIKNYLFLLKMSIYLGDNTWNIHTSVQKLHTKKFLFFLFLFISFFNFTKFFRAIFIYLY